MECAIKNGFGGEDLKNKLIKRLLFGIFRAVFIFSFGYVVLYPIIYMLSRSIIPPEQAVDPSIVWVTKEFSLKNFHIAFEALDYLKTLGITCSVQVLSGIIEMVSCAVVAYGFARFDFPFKNLLFALVIITMIVPSQAIVVPMFLNYSRIDFLGVLNLLYKITGKDLRVNILNTGWTFYLPSILAIGLKSGLFIFIFRQFFKGFPKELEEAALIDGAGQLRTFVSIVVPSSGVSFLCVFIFSLIAHWNDYYLSAMFFSDNYPMAVRLNEIESYIKVGKSNVGTEATANVAVTACLLFLIPIIVVYLILQKRFIESIETVGIVG